MNAIKLTPEDVKHLTPEERVYWASIINQHMWLPQVGPQMEAYYSPADILLYGGQAGGGKTDLALGLAATAHQVSAIYRREAGMLSGMLLRMEQIVGNRDGLNASPPIRWRLPGDRLVFFGGMQHLGDERKYQGQARDLIAFDEGAHFLEQQIRFLMGWNRTTTPGQRCRVLITSNPPTPQDGDGAVWMIEMFAPWLDPNHEDPAEPGELRWFSMVDGEEVELETGDPFTYKGELIEPKSRTFIPSGIDDNAFLSGTGYKAQLQALPEPLRSQLLHGNFLVGQRDSEYQVIPTAWVEAAMDRWTSYRPGPMDSMGVDVARGGDDSTVIARRHGEWFDELICKPGADTPDGPTTAAMVISHRRNECPVHVDSIGVGSAVVDFLASNGVHTMPVNVSERSLELDKGGNLKFANLKAQLWWRMREALDPANGLQIALPPDKDLRVELITPRWQLRHTGVQVESKEDVKKRIGRSTDRADALVLANMMTARRRLRKAGRACTGWKP